MPQVIVRELYSRGELVRRAPEFILGDSLEYHDDPDHYEKIPQLHLCFDGKLMLEPLLLAQRVKTSGPSPEVWCGVQRAFSSGSERLFYQEWQVERKE